MPYKPKRACRKQGCPALTSDPSGYCPLHAREAQKQSDSTRGTSTERGYDRRWRKERGQFLYENPLCATCLEEGKVTAATTVDHIIPHHGEYQLFWDKTNWQSLCTYHHNEKTAKEDGAFGNNISKSLPR